MVGRLGRLGRLEEHAFFIIFISFVLMLFWHAVWELLSELASNIEVRYGVKKWKIHMISVLLVILLIGFFPQILERI